MLNISDSYNLLDENSREEFQKIITILQEVGFVCEKTYAKSSDRLTRNAEYIFISLNEELVRGYLSMAGTELISDVSNGLYIARKSKGRFLKLTKHASIFLLVLRGMYEDKLQQLSLSSEVRITLGELLCKCEYLGVLKNNPTQGELKNALKILTRYRVIDKGKGDLIDLDTKFIVYPTIIHIIDSNIIQKVLEQYREYRRLETEGQLEEQDDESIDKEIDSEKYLKNEEKIKFNKNIEEEAL